jgi:hypothetical protein
MINQTHDLIIELYQLTEKFKEGRLSIGDFLQESRLFIDVLEMDSDIDDHLLDCLHGAWFDIEQAYAVALDRKESINNYDRYIKEGIGVIEKQLQQLLRLGAQQTPSLEANSEPKDD